MALMKILTDNSEEDLSLYELAAFVAEKERDTKAAKKYYLKCNRHDKAYEMALKNQIQKQKDARNAWASEEFYHRLRESD